MLLIIAGENEAAVLLLRHVEQALHVAAADHSGFIHPGHVTNSGVIQPGDSPGWIR